MKPKKRIAIKKMLNPEHFRKYCVEKPLKMASLHSLEAEKLLCGTSLMESHLVHLVQIPSGPARGLFQIENDTYIDLKERCRLEKPETYNNILNTLGVRLLPNDAEFLIWNLWAGCLIARLKYLFDPDPIPSTISGQAYYWNKVYNTKMSSNSQQKYVELYMKTYL